jgi:ferredoxin
VAGKARLLREDFCDGIGDCLPVCPAGAIRKTLIDAISPDLSHIAEKDGFSAPKARNWPIQIKLTATQSPAFRGKLVLAADCAGFRGCVERDSPLLIGCPKLDGVDYSDKLAELFAQNPIARVVVHRMSVPCCSGLARMVEVAIEKSGRAIPCEIIVTEVN